MKKLIKVNFPFLNKSVEIPLNSKISEACDSVGKPLNLVCGGKGKCKKCTVEIEEKGIVKNAIACQTEVSDGIKILVKDEEIKAKILIKSILNGLHYNPALRSKYIPQELLRTKIAGNDWITIEKSLDMLMALPSLNTVQKLSTIFHSPEGITCILINNVLVDVLPGKKEDLFALAFDIGTTSVVGYLFNMNTFELIGIGSKLNKQTRIGGDVISRIDYSINNPDGLGKLHSLVIETVNEIIENLCNVYHIDKNDVYQATFCGNSTMQHLFLKINPEYLGQVPFSSTIHMEMSAKASALNININPDAHISFLPLLGGFVGADTSAALLSLPNDGRTRLMIDLGTNGEIAVGRGADYKVTSTACGPALEGAGITSGMRGTTGAIEHFSIKAGGEVTYKVIGDVKPKGICGSAIIDIVSELLEYGVISEKGTFRDPEEITEPNLSKRIIQCGKTKAFIICYKEETHSGEPILFSQIDVRQVQLAKGAIRTGWQILIERSGLSLEDIDEIMIAGAFGNYIDIRKAQAIGMIPFHPDVPTLSIGNAAGTGCQIFLLSIEKQKFCQELAANTVHVELASDPEFTDNYLVNTLFARPEDYESVI